MATPTDALREELRASLAAKQALEDRVAAVDAVKLQSFGDARGIDYDSLYKWWKRGQSTNVFRGPRGVLCVRVSDEPALDAELEPWRCVWEEDGERCPRYALLSASGRCRHHDACVVRDGRLTAEEFVETHEERGVDLAYLLERLEAGEIPVDERVERGGRPAAWLLDEAQVLAVIEERFRCKTGGCDLYALGPTGYCSRHATGAAFAARALPKVRKVCPCCGRVREDFPSQQRAGDLCIDCWMKSDERKQLYNEPIQASWDERYAELDKLGLAHRLTAAAELGFAPSQSLGRYLVRTGLAHRRVENVRGLNFVAFAREDFARWQLERHRRGDGRLRSGRRPVHVKARLQSRATATVAAALARLPARQGWAGRAAAQLAAEAGRRACREEGWPQAEVSGGRDSGDPKVKADVRSLREIADRVGVTLKQVRGVLQRVP
jgi:hypothetical protein